MGPSPKKQSKQETSKFKTYQSGGCIGLESLEEMANWIEMANIRYYEHLALEHDESTLVLWEDEKGNTPKELENGHMDIENMKMLKLEIYYHKEGNKYAKVLAINFHLTGKKHSVVLAGMAAHDWIDFEYPVIEKMIKMKDKGYKKLLEKSKKEPFTLKLTQDPRGKGKIVTIDINEDEVNEKGKEKNDETSGDEKETKESTNKSKKTGKSQKNENENKEEITDINKELKKERDTLKKRVLEMELKVENLEEKVKKLEEDKEMFRKAYKEQKRDKEYYEEIIEKMEDEKDEMEQQKKENKRNVRDQSYDEETERGNREDRSFADQINLERQAVRELEQEAELLNLRKHKENLRSKLVTPLTTKVSNPNKKYQRLCRYELVSPGNCRRGKECWFSHEIRSRGKDEMSDMQWQGQWQGNRETDEEREYWQSMGYCFSFMRGNCKSQNCRYTHPGNRGYARRGTVEWNRPQKVSPYQYSREKSTEREEENKQDQKL